MNKKVIIICIFKTSYAKCGPLIVKISTTSFHFFPYLFNSSIIMQSLFLLHSYHIIPKILPFPTVFNREHTWASEPKCRFIIVYAFAVVLHFYPKRQCLWHCCIERITFDFWQLKNVLLMAGSKMKVFILVCW